MAGYGFSRSGAIAYVRLAGELRESRQTIDLAGRRLWQYTQQIDGFNEDIQRDIEACVQTTVNISEGMMDEVDQVCNRLDVLAQKILANLNLMDSEQRAVRESHLAAYHEGSQNGSLIFQRLSFNGADAYERPRIVCIPANELMCETDLSEVADADPNFWGTTERDDDGNLIISGHRPGVEAYEELARKGDRICDLMQNGLSMTEIKEQYPELSNAVSLYNMGYQQAGDAIAVYQYEGTYIFSENGGRHRVLMAKKLGLRIPVLVTHIISGRK